MHKKKCTLGKLACFEGNTVFPDTLLLLRQKWKAFKRWQIVLAKNENNHPRKSLTTKTSFNFKVIITCYARDVERKWDFLVIFKHCESRGKSIELTRILVKWVVFSSSRILLSQIRKLSNAALANNNYCCCWYYTTVLVQLWTVPKVL